MRRCAEHSARRTATVLSGVLHDKQYSTRISDAARYRAATLHKIDSNMPDLGYRLSRTDFLGCVRMIVQGLCKSAVWFSALNPNAQKRLQHDDDDGFTLRFAGESLFQRAKVRAQSSSAP